jgi:hypothetical protein
MVMKSTSTVVRSSSRVAAPALLAWLLGGAAPAAAQSASRGLDVSEPEMLGIAGKLDDAANFLEQAGARHMSCDGGMEWNGHIVSIAHMMKEVENPWKRGERLWSKASNWIGQTSFGGACGNQGGLPCKWVYADHCADPIPTTVEALRDDANSLRLMIDAIKCATAHVAEADQQALVAQEEAKRQAELEAKKKAAAKAEADRQALQEAQAEAAEQEHAKHAEEEAQRRQQEEEHAEKEHARHERIAERYQEEKATADDINSRAAAGYAGAMGDLIGSGHTNGPNNTRVNKLLHMGIGLGFGVVPLYTDTDQTTDVRSHSDTSVAVGFGPRIELGLWPVVTPWFSVGVTGLSFFGALALPGGGDLLLDVAGTARVLLGPEQYVSLAARYGIGFRVVTSSVDAGGGVVDATASGSFHHSYRESAGGIHICLSAFKGETSLCEDNLDIWYVSQQSDAFETTVTTPASGGGRVPIVPASQTVVTKPGSPKLIELEWHERGSMGFFGQLGWSYPRANEPGYPDTTSLSGGFMLLGGVRFASTDTYGTW